MIEIKSNRNIFIDGELLVLDNKSMHDFLISYLGCPVKLDNNLKLSDLIHILYDIKEFINL
jgi:hypothetical protein